jgi:hypothetical protein
LRNRNQSVGNTDTRGDVVPQTPDYGTACGRLKAVPKSWHSYPSAKQVSGTASPGVTPRELIEKVRTVVTDDQGQYRIVQCQYGALPRPGIDAESAANRIRLSEVDAVH